MKLMEYYYDYTPEAYNYIMTSRILRNRDKKILEELVKGKRVKEIYLSNLGCAKLSKIYGVSKTNIRNIKNKKQWVWLTDKLD